MSNKPVLGYWSIRGLAEPIRLMLEYCGNEYEDKKYVCGGPPDFDGSCWTDVKFSLGLDFPNLPYFIDGDCKLTESFAIMKHIARKNKMLIPTNDEESDRCDMLEGIVSDFRRNFTSRLCYRPDFEENKISFLKDLPEKALKIDKYLADKKWLAGDQLTYVDFAMCEIFDHVRLMSPGCFEKFSNISQYLANFFELEKVKEYRESARFHKFPINNTMAQWGGKAE